MGRGWAFFQAVILPTSTSYSRARNSSLKEVIWEDAGTVTPLGSTALEDNYVEAEMQIEHPGARNSCYAVGCQELPLEATHLFPTLPKQNIHPYKEKVVKTIPSWKGSIQNVFVWL